MKRGVSRRRGVRGGVREIYALIGGSGVRGRSRGRSGVRGGDWRKDEQTVDALLGGSGVRGRGRSVRRSRGGQYDRGREFRTLGGSGVRSRRRVRGGVWRNVPIQQVY